MRRQSQQKLNQFGDQSKWKLVTDAITSAIEYSQIKLLTPEVTDSFNSEALYVIVR